MNKNKISYFFNIIFLVTVFFGVLIYADSNGIWHNSSDIRGGIFGLDEQVDTLNFTFINPVYFTQNIGIKTTNPQANLEVEDDGTTSNVILKVTADDENPYGIVVGNDFSSTSDTDGLRLSYSNSGVAQIGSSGNLSLNPNGNVGIGTNNPSSKLTVDGEIRLASTNISCDSSVEGAIRYNSSTKEIQFCDGTNWESMGGSGGGTGSSFEGDLIGGTHTGIECQESGGFPVEIDSGYVCRFNEGTCFTGWTQYQNWGITKQTTCNGCPAPYGYSCTTSGHTGEWLDKRETCPFSAAGPCTNSYRRTCYASYLAIGCI